jgi:hypothetical protein
MADRLSRKNIAAYLKSSEKVVVGMFLLLFCHLSLIEAQDNHYWAQQYGAEGTILGGAMVGGVDDNSAVYYNPGAIAFTGMTTLSVDANVYRLDKIFISDGAGKDINLNSAKVSVYPQIIAGMLNLFKDSKFRFSYTMLTRNHGNVLMNSRYTSEISGSGSPSATTYVGAFDYVNQLNELWFGAGSGYQISDKLGVGAILFISYRGQSYQLTNYVQEVEPIDNRNVFRTQNNDEAIKYTTFHLLSKLGLSYADGSWKLGITLTTPSLSLYGSGTVQRENSVITVSENVSDMVDNFLIMDRKTGVKAGFRHPLSIATGAEYKTNKTRLAFSAEYFFKTGTYHLMEPVSAPFVYPASYLDSVNYQPMIDNYLDVELATEPVLNFGIGFSREVYKKLTLLFGASTDFSSYDENADANEMMNTFGGFDIYHFSGGLSYNQQRQNVTIGFSYSFSPSEQVPPYTVINQAPDFTDKALISAHSSAIILGYTYYFTATSE